MTEPARIDPPGPPGSLAPPRTSGSAVAALIIAIASWFVCPIIGGIVALVLAGSAAREIRRYQGALAGAGMVTAARIIAWAHLLIVPIILLWVLGAVGILGASLSGGTSTDPAGQPPSVTVPWEPPPTTDPMEAAIEQAQQRAQEAQQRADDAAWEVDSAALEVDNARLDIDNAQLDIEQARDFGDAAELRAAQAEMAQAQKGLRAAEAKLAKAKATHARLAKRAKQLAAAVPSTT